MLRFVAPVPASLRSRVNLATNPRPGIARTADGFTVYPGTDGQVSEPRFVDEYVRYMWTVRPSSAASVAIAYAQNGVPGGRGAGEYVTVGCKVRTSHSSNLKLMALSYRYGSATVLHTTDVQAVPGGGVATFRSSTLVNNGRPYDALGFYVMTDTVPVFSQTIDVADLVVEVTQAYPGATTYFDGATGLAGHTTHWTAEAYRSPSVAVPLGFEASSAVALECLSWDEDMDSRAQILEPQGLPDPIVVYPRGGRFRPTRGTLRALMTPDQLSRLRALARSGNVWVEDTTEPARARLVGVRALADNHVPGLTRELREVTLSWTEVAP